MQCKGKACIVEKFMPIVKMDDERHIACCVVAEPDKIDLQGDRSSKAEIEKAAHRFMENLQRLKTPGVGVHHERPIEAAIIENTITKTDGEMLGDQKLSAGSWYQCHKVYDEEIWRDIKSGEITGLSRQGRGIRTPISGVSKAQAIAKSANVQKADFYDLSDEDLDRVDWVHKGANGRKVAIIKMSTEGDEMSTVSSAAERIDELAGGLVAKSNGPLDHCAARTQVRKQYPSLAEAEEREYRIEQMARLQYVGVRKEADEENNEEDEESEIEELARKLMEVNPEGFPTIERARAEIRRHRKETAANEIEKMAQGLIQKGEAGVKDLAIARNEIRKRYPDLALREREEERALWFV